MRKQIKIFSKGITLIEVAATVAAGGVLTAVLMPTLAKARRDAGSAVCRANMKEMGTLLNFYSADNEGRMVPGFPYGGGRWWDRLRSYYVTDNNTYKGITATQVPPTFCCPAEWRKSKTITGAYGYNIFFACPTLDDTTPNNPNDNPPNPNFSYYWWSKRDKFKQPSTLPAFWDLSSDPLPPNVPATQSNGYPNWKILKYGWDPGPVTRGTVKKVTGNISDDPTFPITSPNNGPAPTHGASINYLFVDGHAGNMGLWPYNETVSPLTGMAMDFGHPGVPNDYLTYFHPIRKLFQTGTSGRYTVGDGYYGSGY